MTIPPVHTQNYVDNCSSRMCQDQRHLFCSSFLYYLLPLQCIIFLLSSTTAIHIPSIIFNVLFFTHLFLSPLLPIAILSGSTLLIVGYTQIHVHMFKQIFSEQTNLGLTHTRPNDKTSTKLLRDRDKTRNHN